jgi:hypothetical protein
VQKAFASDLRRVSQISAVLGVSKAFQLVVQDYVRIAPLMIAVILLEMLEILCSTILFWCSAWPLEGR